MKIVMLGDSITDAGKNSERGSTLPVGQSYVMLLNAELSCKYPQKLIFDNQGISGNRIVDVYARIKADCWNKQPDVVSILIGVNDVWHEVGNLNGVDQKRFYRVYKMLVEDTKERYPGCKFILMEPFVLKARATEENWDYFKAEIAGRGKAVSKIAEETGSVYVPLQQVFDKACSIAPADYWLADGVHPTPAGHHLIAEAWKNAFESKIFLK